jgi:hypothetical protein
MLSSRSPVFWAIWSIVAAFTAYFCTYAFRKPFSAASFTEETFFSLNYKTGIVIAQMIGYALSKFIGIKVIAEMTPERRALGILTLVGLAEVALLGFAIVPRPWNLVFMFVNGVSLGMVFGLVLGFLEGRQSTEALAAGLCASFIVADGVVTTVGGWLLLRGVNEFWMPFVTGLVFVPPLLFSVWMLSHIPPPSAADIEHRSERSPMTAQDRGRFFWKYATGLMLIMFAYLLITILRSVRSDFKSEIWGDLGYAKTPDVFLWSELVIGLVVLLVNGVAVLILDNRKAFFVALTTALCGLLLVLVALVAKSSEQLGGFEFMVVIGLGLYLPYVAVHTTIFERMIAIVRDRGNLGYLMYLVDAFGYLGYVGVLLAKNWFRPSGPFLGYFESITWIVAIASIGLLLAAHLWFSMRLPRTAQD